MKTGITGLSKSFNLESLAKFTSGLGDRDVVRGSQGLVFKTLYKKTKETGQFKVKQRAVKQQAAKDFVKLALTNTIRQLKITDNRQREFLERTFDSIIKTHLNISTIRGDDLKKVVQEAQTSIETARFMDHGRLSVLDSQLNQLSGKSLAFLMQNASTQNVEVDPPLRARFLQLKDATALEVRQGYLDKDGRPDTREKLAESRELLRKVYVARIGENGFSQGEAPDLGLAKQIAHDEIEGIASTLQGEQRLDEGTIFRGNSLASSLLTSCAKVEGKAWLQNVVGDTIREVCDTFKDLGLQENSRNDEAHQKMTDIYSRFITKLCGSAGDVPKPLCDLVKSVNHTIATNKGTDSSSRNGSLGILLLRLVAPTISSPGSSPIDLPGLEITGKGQKALLVFTRMVQAQSNRVPFDEDSVLNGELNKHKGRMDNFYNQVLQRGELTENKYVNLREDFDYL